MSSQKAKSLARQQAREEQLRTWGDAHRVNLDGLDEGQKWLVFAALQILAVIGQVRPLRRVLGYFLAHCGMGLGSTRIAALLGLSDRAIHDAAQVIAYFNYITRIAEGLGVEPETFIRRWGVGQPPPPSETPTSSHTAPTPSVGSDDDRG